MRIFVDSDACPMAIRNILVKVAERMKLEMFFVANQYFQLKSSYTQSIVVPQGDTLTLSISIRLFIL